MIKAPINKIIPYSVVDGPGNRVAIFVQKCNIHCLYCHNPETQNLCNSCGRCVKTCRQGALSVINGKVVWDKTKCISCDACIKTCQRHASPKVIYMTPEEVFREVQKSIPFIRGISVSGGECDLYPQFLFQLFKLAKQEHLTCLMDCNGTIDLSEYPALIEISDGVMLDVKSWDDKVFQKLTGFSNENVKKNLIYLSEKKKIEEIRIVSLPGFVDADAVIDGIAGLIKSPALHDIPLKLIRFRHFGVRGILEDHPAPSMQYMETLKKHALSAGFSNVLII